MLELMPHDISVLPGFYVDNRPKRGVTVEHDVRNSENLEGMILLRNLDSSEVLGTVY